ncbi:DUF4387 domain-containing protein [Microvirga antarctica]|uniref:DUF4387 domain-containing protein n=1 Tax=Microvirga antarctica TaxID=2819233 RepID=UPI001B317744|nr:DUF4387 domain-containing protein [Microvirga antarctica]
MAKLGELASLIRSKNAGPFELTFDIMFDTFEVFERVRTSCALSAETFACLYRFPIEDVRFFVVPQALAFKISIPRPRFQGDLHDADNHGGQQYAPLIDVDIP